MIPCKFFQLVLLLTIIGCTKPDVNNNPDPEPDPEQKVSGIIYFKKGPVVCAFDLAQEKMVWETSSVYGMTERNLIYDDGMLYSNSGTGVTALNATEGTVAWNLQLPGYTYHPSNAVYENQPIVSDSILFLTTINGDESILNAIHKKTGKALWYKVLQDVNTGDARFSTPVAVGEVVYALGHRRTNGAVLLNAFNIRTGELKYSIPVPNGEHGCYLTASKDGKTLYLLGNRIYFHGTVTAVDAATGEHKWTSQNFEHLEDVAVQVDNGLIWVHGYNDYFALDGITGALKVSIPLPGLVMSHRVSNGKIFGFDYEHKFLQLDANGTQFDEPLPSLKTVTEAQVTAPGVYETGFSTVVLDETNAYVYQRVSYLSDSEFKWIDGSILVMSQETGKLVKKIRFPGFSDYRFRDFILVKDHKYYAPNPGYLPFLLSTW